MGLFDFLSDAGDDDINATVEVSQERQDELRKQNIERNLAGLDIDGEQVSVEVNGPVAVLTGSAPNQESLEKMVLCAGNQHGIGKVDCQVKVDAPPPAVQADTTEVESAPTATEPASTFYTVKSGDTLGKIAQEFYGKASDYMLIFEANQPMLKDPDKIYPGQSLRIPPHP